MTSVLLKDKYAPYSRRNAVFSPGLTSPRAIMVRGDVLLAQGPVKSASKLGQAYTQSIVGTFVVFKSVLW